MLVVLNGYPGVGKLTIGRVLADRLQGRLLDNHTVYNVAFALTTFRTPEFYDAVRAVRAVADTYIAKVPADIPLILTETLAGRTSWGDECWCHVVKLAKIRGPLHVVHIHCDPVENMRRIQDPARGAKRKPRDADMARRNHANGAELMGADAERLLRIDATNLSSAEAAKRVHDWLGVINA